jgi:hypothetical protein
MARMQKSLAVLAASALLALPAAAQKQPDPKAIQQIFDCLAVGLPKDWKKAWVVMSEVVDTGKQRRIEGKFFYATAASDKEGRPLSTCGAAQVAQGVNALNADLPPDQRRWKQATLTFTSEGKFDLHYDYAK